MVPQIRVATKPIDRIIQYAAIVCDRKRVSLPAVPGKGKPRRFRSCLAAKKNRTQKDPLLLKRETWFSDLICVLFLNKYKTYSFFTLHGNPVHAYSGGEPMLPLPIHSKYMRSVTKKERKEPMS